MRAYILASGRRILPFDDPVADSMIGNERLGDRQAALLARAGLEVVRVARPEELPAGRHLVTWDDVYFTRRVLDSLLEHARRTPGSLRAGLPAGSLLVGRTRALQDLDAGEAEGEPLALYRLAVLELAVPPAGPEALGAELGAARPVRVRFREKILEVPTPRNITGSPTYRHPLTSSIVMHLGHWAHVLWANQLSIQVRWVETVLDRKLWAAGRLVRGALEGLVELGRRGRLEPALVKWGALGRMNVIGRGCDIHPTAQLEGVQLGDGVRVGAYTLIRGSLIGAGTTIEDRANVIFCVVGPGSFMSKNASMTLCAGYPEADLSIRGVQCSLFGRKAAMTSGAGVIDMKVKGEIQVVHEGRLQSAGTGFLGACFGHGVFAGGAIVVQAGRAVPNGAVLVSPPGDTFQVIPPDLPPGEPAWAEDGRAVTARTRRKP